jgi:hypothetical protein
VCNEGEVCAPRGGCIPEAQACNAQNCAPPKVCDEGTKQCVNPTANLPLGAECASDQECESKVCATPSMLGGALAGSKGVCSRPCCTSGPCSQGFVCYAPGTGGRYCLEPAKIGRAKVPGSGIAGAACTDGTDCRSGLCKDQKCLDTCCSDLDCKNGTSCRIVDEGGKTFFACAAPPGTDQRHDACDGPVECASNLCAFYVSAQHCVSPCCSSTADCGTVDGKKILCLNAKSPATNNFIVGVCAGTTPINGTKSFGDTCAGNDECVTGLCDGPTARCSSLCCLDSDCPRSTPCRPAPSGVLRCVP